MTKAQKEIVLKVLAEEVAEFNEEYELASCRLSLEGMTVKEEITLEKDGKEKTFHRTFLEVFDKPAKCTDEYLEKKTRKAFQECKRRSNREINNLCFTSGWKIKYAKQNFDDEEFQKGLVKIFTQVYGEKKED